MTKPLDFYFDFSSPYGYLASLAIDELAARHGREVAWHPFLLGPIFKASGNAPLVAQPLKGNYALHDFTRSARRVNAPYRHPEPFPIATQHAGRAFYWVHDRDPAQAKALAKRLFARYFGEGHDIGAAEVVVAEAQALGIDSEALAGALGDPAVKDRLRREVEAAIAVGVCGSPFIIVDGEPFWGADRLDQIDQWLTKPW